MGASGRFVEWLMIELSSWVRPLALIGAVGFAAPAIPQDRGAPLPVLDRLESGLWELRAPNDGVIASICLGDPALLTQPRHGATACRRRVIGSDARTVTVHYSCAGTGSGQTEVRVETPRLAQIDSQGLDRGIPFALRAQARRIGACN
jgi:hypothetical protein